MMWNQIIKKEKSKEYFSDLALFLDEEYSNKTIYPKREDLFKAFECCPFEEVKLVIIGQDPYHGPNQANGLSFSVHRDTALPPSLKNMFKELEDDLGIKRKNGDLEGWARQGVLMLNKILSVEQKKPDSHATSGWNTFTDNIIESLNNHPDTIIYLLWGNHARKLKKNISSRHIIIEGVHPSPLSSYRGFFGSKPYSKINETLKSLNKQEIDWSK